VEIGTARLPEAELGPEIARGRDVVVYAAGPGRVLRRGPADRSMRTEGVLMEHVRGLGYPVPQVFRVGPGELEMARVEGPTMLADLGRHPWRARAYGRLLAGLHEDLHRLPAPAELRLRAPFGVGAALLHCDLHPGNVLLSPDGPMVIDWTNAALGPASADDADTWLLLAAFEPDVPRRQRALVAAVRRRLLNAYLDAIDIDAARAALPTVAARRLADRNVNTAEAARIRRLAAAALSARLR
jgi:tRNA A-37 threonylcarbamoyl transferase component Bud32